jgi:MFS family permease
MDRIRSFGRHTFASLSIRNYRTYFMAQAVSMAGTWMQVVAQALLVLDLTDSGIALGAVIALQNVPILLFGPWGGVIADRYQKRSILYVTQSASGLISLMTSILVFTDTIQLWMVFAIAMTLGFVKVFDNPTQQVFVREMVGRDHLGNAVSLNATEQNIARAIGPAIAGVFAATVGLGACFAFDSISYIVVIFALTRIRTDELFPAQRVAAAKGQLKEGLAYVRSQPVLITLLVMMGLVGMLTYEFSVILPLLAEHTFDAGSSGYAALTGAMGVGSVVGGLYAASHRQGSMFRLSKIALGFGLAVVLASTAPRLIFAVAAMLIVGFFSINFQSVGNVSLQLASRSDMQGRVMGLYTVAFLGTTPIGGPIQGFISQISSPRWSLVIGGVTAMTAAAIGYLVSRAHQNAPVQEPVAAD